MMFFFGERSNLMLGSLEAKAGRFRFDMAVRHVVLLILALVGNSIQDSRFPCGNDDNPISAGNVIFSPRYPEPAWSPMKCIWTVQANAGMHVKLRYSKLYIGGPKEDCDHGALFIYDGCGMDRFLVERICSSNFKPERENLWVSWRSCLTVQFISGTTGTTNKFVLTTDKVSDSCGGNLVTSNQTFSPSLPLYPQTRLCVWIIDARQEGTIELRFDDPFDIGWNTRKGCEKNYVKVKGGRFSSSKTLGTYCGNTRPYTLTSQGRYLRVTMLIDRPNYAFTAHYSFLDGDQHTTNGVCGYILNGNRGEIVSPGYPHQYPAQLQCTWSIKLAKEHQVSLKFDDFDVEGYSDDVCPDDSDFVEINNGPASWSPTIGRFCGKSLPRPVRSDSNEMRVYFKTNEHYGGRGFKATYEIFKESDNSNSSNQFTGIMIGTTCGIIFVVLSALAVFHTRKMRLRRTQADAISTQSFDVHQANAPPSYETVTAFPDRFPSSRVYSELPHLHREISHLLGDHEWDEEGPPAYEELLEGGAIESIHEFDRHNSIPVTEDTGEEQSDSKDDDNVPAVWCRRTPSEIPKGPGCTTEV